MCSCMYYQHRGQIIAHQTIVRRREDETTAQHVETGACSGILIDGQAQGFTYLLLGWRCITPVMQHVLRTVRQYHDIAGGEMLRRTTGRRFQNGCTPKHHMVRNFPCIRALVGDAPRRTIKTAKFKAAADGHYFQEMTEPIHSSLWEQVMMRRMSILMSN